MGTVKTVKLCLIGMLLALCCGSCGSDTARNVVGWAAGRDRTNNSVALFKTVDGVRWARIQSDKFIGNEARNVSAVDNQCVWITTLVDDGATGTAHVVRTLDGGVTWADVSPANYSGSTINIKALSREVAWIAGVDYLAKTTDGGISWDKITPAGLLSGYTYNYNDIEALDATHVWAAGCATDNDPGSSKAVLVRTEDGINWVALPSINAEPIVLGLAVAAPNTVMAGTNANGNLHVSNDGGLTWKPPVNLVLGDVNNVASYGTTVWAVTDRGLFHTSIDGGISFTSQKLPRIGSNDYSAMWVGGISALDSKKIWISGDADLQSSGGLLWTDDGGQSWNEPIPSLYGYTIWRISFVGGVK